MTTNDGITDERQYAAARTDLARFPDGVDPLTAWLSGSEWARSSLAERETALRAEANLQGYHEGVRESAAQEPSEDDAYAAHLERRRHRLRYVKPGVIRCSCGAPGHWGSAAGQEQHAMWHALRAGRAALAGGGEAQ